MSAELTVRQKILVAAVALQAGELEAFPDEDLVVRAWTLFPESFSLRGHFAKHPDSGRVRAKLSGADGLCGLGWLEHVGQSTYRVTRKGRRLAQQLEAVAGGDVAPLPPATAAVAAPAPKLVPRRVRAVVAPPPLLPLPDVTSVVLRAKGEALRKFLRGSPLTFGDACAFWGVKSGDASAARSKIDAVEDLLKRVVESFGAAGPHPDPLLPPLSTCYGLLNLHRLMLGRFARELSLLTAQGEGRSA